MKRTCEFTYPESAMRDGKSRTLPAYRTRVPGLVLVKGISNYTNEPLKHYEIVHEATGMSLTGHQYYGRKAASLVAAILGAFGDWTQADCKPIARAIEDAGFKNWYYKAVQN